MKDEARTQKQLMEELTALRARLADAENSTSESKRVSELLRESEGKYQILLELSSDVIYEIDSQGVIVHFSPLVKDIMGYDPEDIIGKNFINHVHENDRTLLTKRFRELCQGIEYPLEYRVINKSGDIIWVRTKSKPIMKDGRFMGAYGVLNDITERKQAEELYRTLAEKSVAGVYIVQDGHFRFLNKNAASYAGYSPEEMIGMESMKIVCPEDREAVTKNAVAMLRGRRTSPYEFRMITQAGNTRWIMETVTSISYEGKRAILGNSMDVTELKEVRQKLAAQKVLAASIMDAIPHAVVGLRNRRIIFANNAVEGVFGWKPEELIGQKTRVLYRSGEDFTEIGRIVYAALEEQRTYNLDVCLRRKDGRDIMCRLNTAVVGDNLTDGEIVVVYEDITEQKRADEALRESRRHLADIIAFLPDATFVIDRQGRVTAWNRVMEEMTGVSAADMLGKGDYEYSLPFYGVRRPIIIDLVLAFDKDIEKQYSFVKKKGDVIWAEADVPVRGKMRVLWGKAGPLYDSDGGIIGAIESIRDITERKRMEEELQRMNSELQEIVAQRTEELMKANQTLAADVVMLRRAEEERERLILELQGALNKVKLLSGLLPICASCKKIRDDNGYWNQIESYIRDHSEAEFSHSICPDCAKKLYPEFYKKIQGDDKP